MHKKGWHSVVFMFDLYDFVYLIYLLLFHSFSTGRGVTRLEGPVGWFAFLYGIDPDLRDGYILLYVPDKWRNSNRQPFSATLLCAGEPNIIYILYTRGWVPFHVQINEHLHSQA
jgi:hypothetical protein